MAKRTKRRNLRGENTCHRMLFSIAHDTSCRTRAPTAQAGVVGSRPPAVLRSGPVPVGRGPGLCHWVSRRGRHVIPLMPYSAPSKTPLSTRNLAFGFLCHILTGWGSGSLPLNVNCAELPPYRRFIIINSRFKNVSILKKKPTTTVNRWKATVNIPTHGIMISMIFFLSMAQERGYSENCLWQFLYK